MELVLISFLVWPLIYALSTLKHIKANDYNPRYFLPLVSVAFVIHLSLLLKLELDFEPKLKEKLLMVSKIRFGKRGLLLVLIGAISLNFLSFRAQARVFPEASPHRQIDKYAFQLMPNPDFIAGDYWSSWPMKLYISDFINLPILGYRMEDQYLFTHKQKSMLDRRLSSNSKGICFGPISECGRYLDLARTHLQLPFNENMSLRSFSNVTYLGTEIHLVEIIRDTKSRRCWSGGTLPTLIGQKVPGATSVLAPKGKAGFLTYGPYIGVTKGRYKYTLYFRSYGKRLQKVGSYDVMNGNVPPSENFPLMGSDGNNSKLQFEFDMNSGGKNQSVESQFRVVSNGLENLEIMQVCLEKV